MKLTESAHITIYNLGFPTDTEQPWRCYNCKDGLCAECVGVPCMCECPWPKTSLEPEFQI